MTYFRIDVEFPDHPKALALDDHAFAMHIRAMAWSKRLLTDGQVPPHALPKLTQHKRPATLVSQLVEAKLWDQIEGGWQIHDWRKWNMSKADVLVQREAARDRMQRHRSQDVRANNERSSPNVQRPLEQRTEIEVENKEPPTPSESPPTPKAAPKQRRTRLPDAWQPTEALLTWAATEFPTVDVQAQTDLFRDHWRANGEVKDDWDATWRNWIRRSRNFAPMAASNGHGAAPNGTNGYDLAAVRGKLTGFLAAHVVAEVEGSLATTGEVTARRLVAVCKARGKGMTPPVTIPEIEEL